LLSWLDCAFAPAKRTKARLESLQIFSKAGMLNKNKAIYSFGQFRLETQEARLTHDGEVLTLPPKTFSLLLLLLERPGRLVEKDEILRILWPDSFVEEANLTVHMSALRRMLASVDSTPYIETVPKRGYRFLAPVTVKEVASESPTAVVNEPPKPDPAPKVQPVTRRWLWAIPIAIVFLGGLVFLFDWWRAEGPARRTPPVIAVLPFQSLAGQRAEDRYLALGMADALINRFGMLPNFNVRPTGQVSKFDQPGVDALAAARELRADWVLTGSIQHLDNRLRVTVQLTRARDGKTVWAEKYDEFFTNMFAVQDDISERLAKTVAPKLSGEDARVLNRRYTENTEVFRLYAQGRMEMQRFLPDSYTKARDLFEQAIALDPSYPMAYSALADVLVTSWYREPENREKYAARARECVAAMRKLDPELPELYLASGWLEQFIDHDWTRAEGDFHHALAINPNLADGHASLAWLLHNLDRLRDAEQEFRRAFELNPVGEGYGLRLAVVLYDQQRFEESLAVARSVKDENASALYANNIADVSALCLIHLKRPEEAIREIERIPDTQYRGSLATKAKAYALARMVAKARATIQQAIAANRRNSTAIAAAVLALGDREQAIILLTQAVDQGEAGANMLKADLDLAPIRTDPRYKALLSRMRLPTE
jgi:DNA-binding winged helix-turn-helix (wHTH) protein/TolB-like protein/Tfp pilus assembly protein PilF